MNFKLYLQLAFILFIFQPRKRLNDISNFTPSADKQTSVILTEGSKEYRIAAPDHKSVNLHQPKICKAQLDTLKGLVQLGISFASNYSITMGSYKTYERHLCENRFLRSHEFLEHILHHLENGNTESFIQQVQTVGADGLTNKANALLEILLYTLTSFHLVFSIVTLLTQNHERKLFIENFVPSLLSSSKITGCLSCLK